MKMKKALLLVLCMVVAMFALTACGGSDEPAAPADGDPIAIRIAHTEAEDRSLNMAALEFEKYVEAEAAAAGFNVDVQVYPNGSFSGSDADILQAVNLGQIEIAYAAASAYTNFDPQWGVLDMPFLFDTADDYFAAMDGELGAYLQSTLEASTDFKVLGYSFMGVKQITNAKQPVHTVDDLAGLKMRTQQSDAHIAMYEAMGANATPMSFGEVYTALQQGTCDGQDQSGTIILAQKWYEVQKYLTVVNINYGTMPFTCTNAWWDSLDPALQEIVQAGVDTYILDWQRDYELNAEAEAQAAIAEAGVECYTPTAEELQTFKDACAPVLDQFKGEWGADVFAAAGK